MLLLGTSLGTAADSWLWWQGVVLVPVELGLGGAEWLSVAVGAQRGLVL